MPWLLLVLFCLALSVGATVGCLMNRRGVPGIPAGLAPAGTDSPVIELEFKRPSCWLVVRGNSLTAVKAALGVSNAKPCPVADAFRSEQRIFIAPPVGGWILVVGSDLPDPAEDVDACFRFVLGVSRKLGHVQFFSVNPVLQHHAWVRAEKGRVIRAYAWAGRTLWKQGRRTSAERELELTCLDYFSEPESFLIAERDAVIANTEKVPLLANRWSLDPVCIGCGSDQTARGIVGEGIPRY